MNTFYKSNDNNFTLLLGDTFQLLSQFDYKFDMIFADPPYFLSNDGLTIKNGKLSSVKKGEWDRSLGFDKINEFNYKWLSLVKDKMKNNATIWVTGTKHNIFSVGQNLLKLGFKILNVVTWVKSDPPLNFSHKYFTYSAEYIIWAKKDNNTTHYFNFELMKQLNGNNQMRDVWQLRAVSNWEKSCGKHPTQKPLALLCRIILASTSKSAWVLDPFTGSSTTGIAANLFSRKFLGIDSEEKFLEISMMRKKEIEDEKINNYYINKVNESNYNSNKLNETNEKLHT